MCITILLKIPVYIFHRTRPNNNINVNSVKLYEIEFIFVPCGEILFDEFA